MKSKLKTAYEHVISCFHKLVQIVINSNMLIQTGPKTVVLQLHNLELFAITLAVVSIVSYIFILGWTLNQVYSATSCTVYMYA